MNILKDRIYKFIDNLPSSSVSFIYFKKNQFDNITKKINVNELPYITYNIHLLQTIIKNPSKQNKFYLAHSLNRDGCYVYSEDAIKYIVNNISMPNNRVISFHHDQNGNINHGNHFTFVPLLKAVNGNIVIKSHKTEYSDVLTSPALMRYTYECNFEIDRTKFYSNQIADYNTFINQDICKSGPRDISPPVKVNQKLSEESDQFMLYLLTNVIMGNNVSTMSLQGGLKIELKNYVNYKGHRYLIRYDLHKNPYILYKKRKLYKFLEKKGGTNTLIETLTEDFIRFIHYNLIINIEQNLEDIQDIFLLYDSMNTIKTESPLPNNDFFTIIIDTDIYRFIFRNDIKIVYSAYLLRNKAVVNLTLDEKKIVDEFNLLKSLNIDLISKTVSVH